MITIELGEDERSQNVEKMLKLIADKYKENNELFMWLIDDEHMKGFDYMHADIQFSQLPKEYQKCVVDTKQWPDGMYSYIVIDKFSLNFFLRDVAAELSSIACKTTPYEEKRIELMRSVYKRIGGE